MPVGNGNNDDDGVRLTCFIIVYDMVLLIWDVDQSIIKISTQQLDRTRTMRAQNAGRGLGATPHEKERRAYYKMSVNRRNGENSTTARALQSNHR